MFFSVPITSIGHHAGDLYWMISKVAPLKPKKILEIGVCNGGSLRFWAELTEEKVVGVDINPQIKQTIPWNWRNNAKITLIIGDSTLPLTANYVKEIIGENIDFLYIDGDHSYNGVENDFELYSKLVRPGGIVGFHDLDCSEPCNFFNSLKGQKIICDYRNAIGCIYMDSSAPNSLTYEHTPYTGPER
jgi:predicted O-methyltransferase YrrM